MTSTAVLGLGGCVDYELKVSGPVLEELITHYRIRRSELTSTAPVSTERDLVISILDYLGRGAGGEHFVAAADALERFAQRFPRRITLGGTSVRAGITMSRLGVPSTLHLVSLNDHVRRLLPADCDYVSSGDRDTLYPHLIVQFDAGLRIRAADLDLTAPFPNRLIYVNDPANDQLRLSDQLGELLGRARLLLISGFNAIRDPAVLDRRLATLHRQLHRLPADAVVYYEDAAFHQAGFNRRVRAALLDRIDVYGLNEEELQAYLGRPIDLLSVPDVAGALWLRVLIPGPILVLHTKYWAVAFGDRATGYTEALDRGIATAAARYSYGDDYTDDQLQQLPGQPRRSEAVIFAAALERQLGAEVRCRPGFRLDVAEPTTVGLGDTFVGGFLTALPGRQPPAE